MELRQRIRADSSFHFGGLNDTGASRIFGYVLLIWAAISLLLLPLAFLASAGTAFLPSWLAWTIRAFSFSTAVAVPAVFLIWASCAFWGISLMPLSWSRWCFSRVAFALVLFLGGLLRFNRDRLLRGFIDINNQFVKRGVPWTRNGLILLLPHCLQRADCPYKITFEIENCRACGRCSIQRLIEMGHRHGVKLYIATGGRLARRIIKENKAQAIVAVACEFDLATGIRDTYPLPVVGILNLRPHGPCINTDVVVEDVERAVEFFLDGEQPNG